MLIPDGVSRTLKSMAKDAMRNFGKEFQLQAKSGQRKGLEAQFQEKFIKAKARPENWKPEEYKRRSELSDGLSKQSGKVDVVFEDGKNLIVGVEFKVCQLPRPRSTGRKGSLYDIGQISYDYLRLQKYKIKFGYCVIVLDGPIVGASNATVQSIRRHFHNAMFIDYVTSRLWGELRDEKTKERREQIKAIKEMKFHRPFCPRFVRKDDFCVYDSGTKVAVIGIRAK